MAGLDYRGKGLGLAPNEYCTLDRIRQKSLQMETRMSDELLIENIKALLHLNASNSLVPHGIGNHARDLLDASITSIDRLRAEVARLKEELAEYEKHDAARDEKIRSLTTYHGLGCACSYDNVDDVCEHHSPKLMALTQQLAAANGRVEMLREALTGLRDYALKSVCYHDETHRAGAIWEICDLCGKKWADDEGGKPEFKEPKEISKANAALSNLNEDRDKSDV
jgi:hypothetical protein